MRVFFFFFLPFFFPILAPRINIEMLKDFFFKLTLLTQQKSSVMKRIFTWPFEKKNPHIGYSNLEIEVT
jgi:hypothetical protein